MTTLATAEEKAKYKPAKCWSCKSDWCVHWESCQRCGVGPVPPWALEKKKEKPLVPVMNQRQTEQLVMALHKERKP